MDRDTLVFYKSIFASHRGMISRVARELEMNPCSITLWLQGKYRSPRLEVAIPWFLMTQGLPYEPVKQELDPLEVAR